MISETVGTLLKKNTKPRVWWMKLGVALILSNIFFFLLFSGPEKEILDSTLPGGWVEMQLEAQLLTPFHMGKKVLLIHRNGRKKLEGVLQTQGTDPQGRITVLVKEDEAHTLLQHENWEILPYLKHLNFVSGTKEGTYEIRY